MTITGKDALKGLLGFVVFVLLALALGFHARNTGFFEENGPLSKFAQPASAGLIQIENSEPNMISVDK